MPIGFDSVFAESSGGGYTNKKDILAFADYDDKHIIEVLIPSGSLWIDDGADVKYTKDIDGAKITVVINKAEAEFEEQDDGRADIYV